MVHALREAWRVLRADALLIDLRPAIQHSRVGLVRNGGFTVQWATRESLASYRAASRSLTMAKELKLFGERRSIRFSCTKLFPSPDKLREWLCDWYEPESFPLADDLVSRVEEASQQPELTGKIVARIPFMLKVLVKRSTSR